MIVVCDGDESLFFIIGEDRLAIDEVAVALFSFSSDASTQLMEGGEPEILRIEDDDRIC